MSDYQIGEKPFNEPRPDPSVGMGERKAGDGKNIDEATKDWAESGMNTPEKPTKD